MAWDYEERIHFFLTRFKLHLFFTLEKFSTLYQPPHSSWSSKFLTLSAVCLGQDSESDASSTLGVEEGSMKMKNKRIFVCSGNVQSKGQFNSGHCFLYENELRISTIIVSNFSVECAVGTLDIVFDLIYKKHTNIQCVHLSLSLVENVYGVLHLLIGLLGNVEIWIDQYCTQLINQSFIYTQAIMFNRHLSDYSHCSIEYSYHTYANVYNIIISPTLNYNTTQENSIQLNTLSLNSSFLVLDTLSRDGFVVVHSNGKVESTFSLKKLNNILGMTHPPSFYSRWVSNSIFLATKYIHPSATVLLIIVGNIQDEQNIQHEQDTIYNYIYNHGLNLKRIGMICFLKTIDDVAKLTLLN